MNFTPATAIPVNELMTIPQAAKRLPHLTESQLRAKIAAGQVRSIWIAGCQFVHEGDLQHSFGERFVKRDPAK